MSLELGHTVRRALAAGGRRLSLVVALPWGRARIEVALHHGPGGVRVVAPVGHRDRFAPEAALAHNTTLAVGALVLGADGFRLQAELAPNASFDELAAATTLVAHEAARLANPRRVDPTAATALFAAYAE
jgi:hypothetical protein